jgi:hypothetical protein
MTDFRRCSEILGLLLFGYCVVYFICGEGFQLLRSGCKEKIKKEIDVIRDAPSRNLQMRNRLFSAQSHDENFDLDTLKLLRSEPLLAQENGNKP